MPDPRWAWTILNVNMSLHNIVDLTDTTAHTSLATTAQELTGDWHDYRLRGPSTYVKLPVGTTLTQELGAALYSVTELEEFITLSAKIPDQMVLVIFPQKVHSGSFVQFWDTTTEQTHSIGRA